MGRDLDLVERRLRDMKSFLRIFDHRVNFFVIAMLSLAPLL
jgi:hypothetical protein